jgi:hypothetical protein
MFRCSLCISRRCAVHGGRQGRQCGCLMGQGASLSCALLFQYGRSCGFAVRGLRYRMTRRRADVMPILGRINHAHLSCGASWLLRVWGCLAFVLIYGSKYLVSDLRHDRVAVCFHGFFSPLRKGDSVQFGGKPIISATNRGLSWEVAESCSVVCSPCGMIRIACSRVIP